MIELNYQQKRAIDYAKQGHNIFLTGPAGVGKSYTVQNIVKVLREKGKQVAITASTGIAADQIGGCTLHGFSGCGLAKEEYEILARRVRRNPNAVERWTNNDVLVIDEVSMLGHEFFLKLHEVAKILRRSSMPFGGMQLILVGDFYQLPPIQRTQKDKEPRYLFQSDIWNLCIEKQVLLTKVYRQGHIDFVDMLMQVRECKMSKSTIAKIKATSKHVFSGDIKPTRLFCRNYDVDVMNLKELHKIPGEVVKFRCSDFFESDDAEKKYKKTFMYKDILSLKVGAQVILLTNMPEIGLVNGSRGIVENLNLIDRPQNNWGKSESITVRFSNGIIADIPKATREVKDDYEQVISSRCQFPLGLAWCMTIHRSQGQTIELLEVDLKEVFTYAQVYVALSRGVDLKKMRIKNFNPMKVRTAKSVIKYYKDIKEETESIIQKRAREMFDGVDSSVSIDKRQKVSD